MSEFKPNIWRLQTQHDTKGLERALTNDDADIRKRAAAALRAIGATVALPTLKTVLETEQDPDTRAHILAALESLEVEHERDDHKDLDTFDDDIDDKEETAIFDTEVLRMVRQLESDDDDEIIAAAQKLGDLKDKQAVEPLVIRFKDPKVAIRVRLAVAEALLELESALVEVALLGALRKPDWRVRRNAAAILGQLKADWAVEPLSRALNDKHERVRRTAFAALKYIGTPEALDAIKQAARRKKAQQKADKKSTSEQPAVESNNKPDNSDGADESLSWPKRKETVAPNLAQTKPLDPEKLKQAKAQFEQLKQEKTDDEQ